MRPGRRGGAPRVLFVGSLLSLTACGADEQGYPTEPPCDPPRRVVFDSLPNGPPVEAEVDGVEITGTCGEVEIARQDGSAVLLLVGGCASFAPVGCVADEIHVVFDDREGPITFSLLTSRFGGDPFFTTTSSSITTVQEGDGWVAGDLARDEGDPPIARADLSGGKGGGAGASGVAVRELVFLANHSGPAQQVLTNYWPSLR